MYKSNYSRILKGLIGIFYQNSIMCAWLQSWVGNFKTLNPGFDKVKLRQLHFLINMLERKLINNGTYVTVIKHFYTDQKYTFKNKSYVRNYTLIKFVAIIITNNYFTVIF